MTANGLPTFRQFCERVPLVDWDRLKFELDFSRRLAFDGGTIPLSSRLYGLAFGLRLRVPSGTGQFTKGHGQWCWPWQWHARYYAELMMRLHARVGRTPDPVTGGRPVPAQPPMPDLSPAQRRKVLRFARALRREERNAVIRPVREVPEAGTPGVAHE